MNRQMVRIETKSGTFHMPVGSFYIADECQLCNISTGATMGTLKEGEYEKLSHFWRDN